MTPDPNPEFAGKVAVVTGGAKGIGAATALRLHAGGAAVAVLDVDDAAASIVAPLGARGLHVRCDVSLGDEVERAIDLVASRFGGIDLLVNNAGIQRYGTVTGTSEALWDEVMNVNLKSAFLCARAALPRMLARSGGVVINVSSVQAFLSQEQVAAYTTAKTALLGLTRSIAVDYAPRVRSMAVCPGTIDTPMLRWAVDQSPDPAAVMAECVAMHPLRRIGRPEEVADLIAYLCGERAAFMTGQYVRMDGGLGLKVGGSKRS